MPTPTGDLDTLAAEFSRYRTHLTALAYRLTGTVADAEDAVQESWLRLAGLSESTLGAITDYEGWLVTVVSRICLDRLRSAPARRERYRGPWLPEPIVAAPSVAPSEDPLEAAVRDEGVRMAAMVVLDKLPAQQRVAFVLHDAFSVPFAEIAAILGCSVAAARQYGSRGRRVVAEAAPPPRASVAEQRETVERFLLALRSGDIRAVAESLHPDVALIGDADGKARTARQVMLGADKLQRFLRGLLTMYPPEALNAGRPVLVNGDLGIYLPGAPGYGNYRALDARVQALSIRDGEVATIFDIANPDKLTRLPAFD